MGPVPNGSDFKIMPRRIAVLFTRDLLTVPSIRSLSGPIKAAPLLEPFRSQMDLSLCKHLDRFLSVLTAQFKHDWELIVLRVLHSPHA